MGLAKVARRIAFAALAMLVYSAPSPTAAEVGVSEHEILIGSCGDVFGFLKDLTNQSQAGVLSYINFVNANGGIYGRKIRVLAYDDKFDPDISILCFKRLQQENIFAGAFFTGAAQVPRYASMAEIGKIPVVGFISAVEFLYQPYKRYVIPVGGSFEDAAADVVAHLWDDAGNRRFAVVFEDGPLGYSVLDGAVVALAKRGGTLVARASFSRNSGDFASVIRTLQPLNPQVVILGINIYSSPAFIAASKSADWNPLFVQIPRPAESFLAALGKKGDGTLFAQTVPPVTRTDLKGVSLYRKLLKRYYPETKPSQFSLEGFVYAQVLVEGLRRAGKNLTREGLIDAIESIHGFDVGLGPKLKIDYQPGRHRGLQNFYYTYVRDGAFADVKDWKRFAPKP